LETQTQLVEMFCECRLHDVGKSAMNIKRNIHKMVFCSVVVSQWLSLVFGTGYL